MSATGRAAILLDRDGTIIVDRGYLSDPADVELEPDSGEALRRLADAGFVLVVITNQSGIARGMFDLVAAKAVNARLAAILASFGVAIAGWYLCPHGPADGCDCRKPGPALAYRAASDLNLALDKSWMIGDKPSDAEMGIAVGTRTILLMSGERSRTRRLGCRTGPAAGCKSRGGGKNNSER